MISTINFTPRIYQENILNTCINNNTLVVLPTGIGKTFICLLLSVYHLNKFPSSKILVLTPTKPLSNQFYESFIKYTNIKKEKILLFTGAINPSKRKKLWEDSQVIIATPQTIQSDLLNKRISLEEFSLLTIDECHRSRMKFANTIVSKEYVKQAKNQRILGLTASPGSTKEKINEIKQNLSISAVEIRSEDDIDVKPYIKEKEIFWISVDLPQQFNEIHSLIKDFYKEKLNDLKKLGYTKPLYLTTKKDLLNIQSKFRKELNNKNPIAFHGISLTSQLIKLDYALELLETQGLNQLNDFLNKLKQENTKAARSILKNQDVNKAIELISQLIKKNIKHPKLEKLIEVIKEETEKNSNTKIIIFANYRNTVSTIVNELNKIKNIKSIELLGQKGGITQKKQIETIKKFEEGFYNVLVTSSIGEEGLSIEGSTLAIFFDQVYGIRRIQRAGRVARTIPGKVIFLITKGTRDEAMYWKSKRDISKMIYILKKMQSNNEEQIDLEKFN